MKYAVGMVGLAVAATFAGCRQEAPTAFEVNRVHAYKYELTRGLPMEQVLKDTEWALGELFGSPDAPIIPVSIQDNDEFQDFLSQERLALAAGPEVRDPAGKVVGGLFRAHCANCHGITGSGKGPTAAGIVPYPRDYRMGVFKFKSTTRGSKPTREDLAKLIRHGIGGTSMNPILGLDEEGVQALVDYVIYLSWRGQVERQIIDSAMFDLDLEAGERVLRPEFASLQSKDLKELSEDDQALLDDFESSLDQAYEKEIESLVLADVQGLTDAKKQLLLVDLRDELEDEQASMLESKSVKELNTEELRVLVALKYENLSDQEASQLRDTLAKRIGSKEQNDARENQRELDQKSTFEENWGYIVESVEEIAASWIEAEDDVTGVEPTGEIPVPQNRLEFFAMMDGEQGDALRASVERGHQLFSSELVGCAKCHGKEGKGDGQTNDFDDWTKDWTTSVGLDPNNAEALIPLRARGAWEPKNIYPRNFAEGIFRGGSDPNDLFLRIANGIAGTPMPAATMVEGEFSRQDIWHIINFIRSLDQSEPTEPAAAVPGLTESAMK